MTQALIILDVFSLLLKISLEWKHLVASSFQKERFKKKKKKSVPHAGISMMETHLFAQLHLKKQQPSWLIV